MFTKQRQLTNNKTTNMTFLRNILLTILSWRPRKYNFVRIKIIRYFIFLNSFQSLLCALSPISTGKYCSLFDYVLRVFFLIFTLASRITHFKIFMVWLTDIWEVLYLQQFPKERLIQPKTLLQIFYKLASKSSSYLLKSCLFNLYQNF